MSMKKVEKSPGRMERKRAVTRDELRGLLSRLKTQFDLLDNAVKRMESEHVVSMELDGSGNGDRGISFLSVYVSKITGAFANEKSKKTYDPDPVEVVPSEKKKRGT